MRPNAVAAPLAVLLLVPACDAPAGSERRGPIHEIRAWTTDSADLSKLGSHAVQWPTPSAIEGFFPLGFSRDGWFAYSNRLEGLGVGEPLGTCTGDVPCFDVSLFNVLCETPCAGDIDPDAGPKCECIRGVGINDLEARNITPAKDPRFDEFPIRLDGRVYDIELSFREKAAYGESLTQPQNPETPETRVYLVDDQEKRKLLTTIDHNHAGIGIGVRVAGWLKHPYVDRYVVVLLCRRMTALAEGERAYFLFPVAAKLR